MDATDGMLELLPGSFSLHSRPEGAYVYVMSSMLFVRFVHVQSAV